MARARLAKILGPLPAALTPYVDELRDRDQVWIDVGACLGAETLPYARRNPRIRVFAFEPDDWSANKVPTNLPNYQIRRMAVSTVDGHIPFHINRVHAASSTKSLNPAAVRDWLDGEALGELARNEVASTRLDTFLEREAIPLVVYLKVDAQGADLDVLSSAGDRLADVLVVKAEAPLVGRGVYDGGHTQSELVSFMRKRGFRMVHRQIQSYGQEADMVFHNVALGVRLGIPSPPDLTK